MEPVAFFASSDDKYIPKAVMALRSFQRWHPDCDYFVIGAKAAMRPESMEFLRQYNIQLLDVDEASRFVRQGHPKNVYPTECFYLFKGPELLAERGFTYSISVDGDVFCARPLNIETLLNRIDGFAGRVVGTLSRTIGWKQKEKNDEFDFAFERIRDALGIHEGLLETKYEINTGVLFWNNVSMARLALLEKTTHVFKQCRGCFEGDQDLLTFTAATYDIPFCALSDHYNFNFFEDSHSGVDEKLREQVRRGSFENIYIVHFVFSKPWATKSRRSPVEVHFVNTWREFILKELGDKAHEIFGDLPATQFVDDTKRLPKLIRRIRSMLNTS